MGKAVPRGLKRKAEILMEKFPDSLGTGFEKNKKFIDSLKLPFPKGTCNIIAGYISRKIKQAQES